VAELDAKCFPTPWSISAYTTEVHNPNAYYIVARHNDRIVGYAGMWLVMGEAHITTIGVDPEFRGRKIGERMLINLLDEAIHR
ncbi:MAG: GNAT family N-acetyltransferase, partial [Armatimonadota bacterium]|nr:GNAT family N-acetyltransferase [Armatimonadota bacterium]